MFQNIIGQSEHKFESEHLRRNKQKDECRKENYRKKTILLENMQRLREDFVLHSLMFYNEGCPIS